MVKQARVSKPLYSRTTLPVHNIEVLTIGIHVRILSRGKGHMKFGVLKQISEEWVKVETYNGELVRRKRKNIEVMDWISWPAKDFDNRLITYGDVVMVIHREHNLFGIRARVVDISDDDGLIIETNHSERYLGVMDRHVQLVDSIHL